MNLAEKIRSMSEIVNEEAIAKALSLPAEIVTKVLNGDISDEVLEEYDPSRPPELRVIEETRFVRTRSIGVISSSPPDSAVLTAVLAKILSLSHKTIAVDLGEYNALGEVLGVNRKSTKPTILGYPRGSGLDFITLPIESDLYAIVGMTNLNEWLSMVQPCLPQIIQDCGNKYEAGVFNFPTLQYCTPLLPVADVVVWVLNLDYNVTNTIEIMDAVLQESKDKTIVILNQANSLKTVVKAKQVLRHKGYNIVSEQKSYSSTLLKKEPVNYLDFTRKMKKDLQPLTAFLIGRPSKGRKM